MIQLKHTSIAIDTVKDCQSRYLQPIYRKIKNGLTAPGAYTVRGKVFYQD